MPSNESIVDLAAADEQFSTLVTTLQLTKLDKVLDCKYFCWYDQFTVFAPTNEAFGILPTGLVATLTEDPEYNVHLAQILLYHVLASKVYAADIVIGAAVETLQGETVNTTVQDNGTVLINTATVISADIDADNGVIHVIDQASILSFMTTSIVQVAEGAGSFTSLLAALDQVNLTSALEAGTFTVFAPTDEAFAKIANLELTDDELTEILLYHVIADKIVFALELEPTIVTAQGENITVSWGGYWNPSVLINDNATVVDFDVLASNGVIHVIDEVLLPPSMLPAPPTTAEIAAETEDLSTLVTALQAVELVETLQGEGPLRVFAPTNAAFSALGDNGTDLLLPENKDALANILLYHVASGEVLFEDLRDGDLITTVQGSDIAVALEYVLWWVTGATLNDSAEFVTVDIEAGNGIIHIIDAVLLPPEE